MKAQTQTKDRRHEARFVPSYPITIRPADTTTTIDDAQIINVTRDGVAFMTNSLLFPGERVLFDCGPGQGVVVADVLACERLLNGQRRVRCECVEGHFDITEQEPEQPQA